MKLLSKKLLLIPIVLAAFLIQSCEDDNPFTLNFDNAPPPFNTSQAVSDTTISGGTKIFVIEEGEGNFKVTYKDQINVQITGRTEEGRIFDSSFSNRSASTARSLYNLTPNAKRIVTPTGPATVPPLVEGLRKGLLGMKEGESRTIIVPPSMGYSEQYVNKVGRVGQNGFDLRDQTLTYDVELVSF